MPTIAAAPGQPIPHRPKHSTALAVQSPPSPRVHFPSSVSIVTGVSRPLTIDEAWYLYDFEKHARKCHYCHSPYKRYKLGAALCPFGDGLAHTIAGMVYMYHGEVYERSRYPRKPMRVEIPHTYTFLLEQLEVMEDVARLRHIAPLPTKPSANPQKPQIHAESRNERDAPRRPERMEVVIETARSGGTRDVKDRRKEKYRHEPEYRSEREREREHREHRRDYRAEEKRERSYRKTVDTETTSRDKKYRTENRRPVWVDSN